MPNVVADANSPIVSIIMPVFNSAHLAQHGIRSFLSQSFKDFEVLIVDNFGDDDIADVVAEFGDDRLIYIRNDSNIGMINNFNRGLLFARGKYVTLISSDEMMLGTESLAKRVALLESGQGVDYVWCAYDHVMPDGSTFTWDQQLPEKEIMPAQEALTRLLLGNGNGFRITTVMMRRSILEANGYHIPLVHAGDMPINIEWLLWSRNAGCVRDTTHRNIIHDTHKHDYFGKKFPYLGERDWQVLKLLDKHRARLVAMGLPWMRYEAHILLRLTKVVFRQLPAQDFAQFNHYLSFAAFRWVGLGLYAAATVPNVLLYWPARGLGWASSSLRKRLSNVSLLRRLLGKAPRSVPKS